MEKTDELKFGKYKGKTWGDLLTFEAGKNWLSWWAKTASQGKYANFENKQKATVLGWLGENPTETRVGKQVVDTAFIMNKLEIIEKLCLEILNKDSDEIPTGIKAFNPQNIPWENE